MSAPLRSKEPSLDPSAGADGPCGRAPMLPRTHASHEVFEKARRASFDLFRSANPVVTSVVLGASGLALLSGITGTPAYAATTTETTRARADDGIVYVGMNETSNHEVENLRNRVGASKVHYIKSAAQADKITYKGTSYDLDTEEGRSAFAGALGLTGDKQQALAEVLASVGSGAKDELAQLAIVFRQADLGTRVLERIVFSGHSVGSGVWGDGNGHLSFSAVGKLAVLFPHAAGQVEDLMIAGCYSGGSYKMDNYRAIFPNVKTIWAYDGSAPGAWSGAVPHVLRWERATRGHNTNGLSRSLAEHTRKGENVAVWTVTKGYDNGKELGPIEHDRSAYESSREIVPGFLSGATPVTDPQTGPLRDHYNHIQTLLSRNDLPAEERASLETERDQVIRLLYYKNVSTMFHAAHYSSIKGVFETLGMSAPDFSKLTRAEAMSLIETFDAKVDAYGTPTRSMSYVRGLLHDGLRDLKPSAIPEAWV